MKRTRVASSNIASIGYAPSTATLEVRFRPTIERRVSWTSTVTRVRGAPTVPGGPIYRYRRVPRSVYLALMNAESKGRYFAFNVVGRYETERVR